MELSDHPRNSTPSTKEWKKAIQDFTKPNPAKATWQLLNSIGLYVLLWVGMFFALKLSWWLVVPMALLAGALLVRVFIIFHDCGHGSFFKSKKLNSFWGFITGTLAFTPYQHWRWEHNVHHAHNGHLDRRGVGDIWTMTVEEYTSASPWKRLLYRILRHPIVLFAIGPMWTFMIVHRFPLPNAKRKEKISVIYSNLAIAAMVLVLGFTFEWVNYLIITFIVMLVASTCGVWLFYVQHQFEDTYWEKGENWDFFKAAVQGSSFYKLPKVLQWFSGNIGFHHIHHLSSKIPNYNLEKCHYSTPLFSSVKPLTLWKSFTSIKFRLWDEASMKLISFGQLKRQLRS